MAKTKNDQSITEKDTATSNNAISDSGSDTAKVVDEKSHTVSSNNMEKNNIEEYNKASDSGTINNEANIVDESKPVINGDMKKNDAGENNKTPDSGSDEAQTLDEKQQVSSSDKENEDNVDENELIYKEAQMLLVSNNVKRIWRCPVRGYWFTNKERVNDYEKSTGISLTEYKPDLKTEDEDGK